MPANESPIAIHPRMSWRHLVWLLLALVGARVAFILLMPAVYSTDLHSWLRVMDILDANGNPYRETGVLNWPPFWMQILFGIHQIAKHSGLSPIHLVQATLIGGEAAVLCVTFVFFRRTWPERSIVAPLLVGWALNPVCIFLSCQHCNYDVLVGLFILVAVWMLSEWCRLGSEQAWLAACFFLGMGILAKTVPFMLVPLLLIGFRSLSWGSRVFGAILLAAPFCIGMSVLFTLERHGVMEHVFGYRSLAGWYGFTGLLNIAGSERLMELYQKFSPGIFAPLIAITSVWCYKVKHVSSHTILMLAALIMICIPTFGPGYSPPYILWFLPLLLLAYPMGSGVLRYLLIISWILAVATYTIEYAIFNSHGAFLLYWYPLAELQQISEEWGSRKGQTLIRLPFFLCYLSLVAVLVKNIRVSIKATKQTAQAVS